jgi:hypothetical protein
MVIPCVETPLDDDLSGADVLNVSVTHLQKEEKPI